MKLYGWMYEAFGDRRFTINDFRAVFPGPSPAKVIYDLIRLNYVNRIKRGIYRVMAPARLVEKIVEGNLKQEDILKSATKKYAYCDNDAVNIWTDGYYWTGFTAGFKPIHIKVLKKDLSWWKNFFREGSVEFSILGEHRTFFGLLYVLHPEDMFRIEQREDVPIIPLKEAIEFCRENELTYGPALEYLKVID
ncbi:MAG: hypothetical protein V3R93_05920 [Candidatus Hydrothermarchaeaceae archaeon]